MEVTIISIPRKISLAKWHPKIPRAEMKELNKMALCGVLVFGFTLAKIGFIIPSFAQANTNLETDKIMPGKSFNKAMAAPDRIIADQNGFNKMENNPGAVRSFCFASSAMYHQGIE